MNNSLGTFISKVGIFLFRFPVGILTARFLGPEGKGFLYLIVVSVMVSVAVADLGLGPAATYFIGKDRKRLPALLGNLFAAAVILGLLISGVGWLFLKYLRPDIYSQLPLWMWVAAAIVVPVQLVGNFLIQVLSALLRIKEINIVEVAAVVCQLLLLLLLVVMMGTGVWGAFTAYVLAEILTSASFLILVLRYGGQPSRPDLNLFKVTLNFGIKAYAANLMRLVNVRLDTFLIAYLAADGIQAAGIYSVAVALAELILFVPQSIRVSLFPMVASCDRREANRLTSVACRHTMFLTVSLALVFASFGPFAIRVLYGREFTGAVVPLLILLPGLIMMSQCRIYYSDLSGRGLPGFTTVSSVLSVIVTLILDLLLIPSYGIVGAAVASTCAYTAEAVVAGMYFLRNSGLLWKDVLFFRRSDLRCYLTFLPGARKIPTLVS